MKMSSGSSVEGLQARLSGLTQQLNQKDAELDEEVSDFIDASLDSLEEGIEATHKNIKEGLSQRVERIKEGLKNRKQNLKQKIDTAKKRAKEEDRKEAEGEAREALDAMEENLSEGDLESAYINRWVANSWLESIK